MGNMKQSRGRRGQIISPAKTSGGAFALRWRAQDRDLASSACKKRLTLVGGQLSIESQPAVGTTVLRAFRLKEIASVASNG
jgi:signal transduction histidine kinase